MSARSFRSRSASETQALGRALGEALAGSDDPGLVIALDGDLGAGKTVFVKGLAAGLGVAPDLVSSPTFVIAQRYDGGALRLHHVDLYRIDDESELDGFGFDEMLDPPSVAAIEWSSRYPQALPRDRLAVRIDRDAAAGDEGRRLDVEAAGPRAAAALVAWASANEAAQAKT